MIGRPRPHAGTVYMASRCDACGRENRLTEVRQVAPVDSRTRPYDVTQIEACADRSDCIANFPEVSQ